MFIVPILQCVQSAAHDRKDILFPSSFSSRNDQVHINLYHNIAGNFRKVQFLLMDDLYHFMGLIFAGVHIIDCTFELISLV